MKIDDDSDIGYVVKAHLKIPENLHDHFNDYAPAPEHSSPNLDDLSEFQKWMINNNLGSKPSEKNKKLMCTLNDKREYIIDYRLLKEYMKHGVELIDITSGRIQNHIQSFIGKTEEKRPLGGPKTQMIR